MQNWSYQMRNWSYQMRNWSYQMQNSLFQAFKAVEFIRHTRQQPGCLSGGDGWYRIISQGRGI